MLGDMASAVAGGGPERARLTAAVLVERFRGHGRLYFCQIERRRADLGHRISEALCGYSSEHGEVGWCGVHEPGVCQRPRPNPTACVLAGASLAYVGLGVANSRPNLASKRRSYSAKSGFTNGYSLSQEFGEQNQTCYIKHRPRCRTAQLGHRRRLFPPYQRGIVLGTRPASQSGPPPDANRAGLVLLRRP